MPGPIQPHAFTLRKGGANNRRDRITWQLSPHDCRKVVAASQAAWAAGVPFTRFGTFAWELGGIAPDRCAETTAQFLDHVRDWLAYRDRQLAWAWVQERGPRLGAHGHCLFHIPPDLDREFRPWPLRWTKALLGGIYTSGVLDCQSLYFRQAAFTNPETYWPAVKRKLQYMLKCGPPELETELGLTGWGDEPWGQACKTYGKRAGVWQYRTARR